MPVPYPPDELVSYPKYWGLVAEWVVASFKRNLGEELALELTQEAIARSLPGGKHPWVPGGKATCPVQVGWIVQGLASDRRKSADHRGRVADALRDEFEGSPLVEPVLELMLAGVLSREEHLAQSGLTEPQVMNARARIAAFVRDHTEGKREERGSRNMEASE